MRFEKGKKKRKHKRKTNNQRTINGPGLVQAGSLRAENKEYEASRAAFEHFSVRDLLSFLRSPQQRYTNSLRRARLDFVTWPRTETSNEK